MKLLTIAGVGPGDPSLITLAALNAVKNSTLIAFPVSIDGGESIAEKIVSKWITKEKKKLPLHLPMVFDTNTLKKAWHSAGKKLMKMIDEGEKVVFISQGDISLFSTGSYISKEFEKNYPECLIQLIPGVSSFSAAAAKSQLPLAFQEEQLLVLSVPDSSSKLTTLLLDAASSKRVIVLMKLGNKWSWVKPLLERLDLLESSVFAEKIGFSDEKIIKGCDFPEDSRPYFSLLIIRQSWPSKMP